MRKAFLFSLFMVFFMSCSATHRAQVKEKIRANYTEKIKVAKVASNEPKTVLDEVYQKEEITTPVHVPAEKVKEIPNTVYDRPKDAVTDYINLYAPYAKETMETHKIPASITLAQGILESGIGKGTLAQNANNHFGIKCKKEWEGEKTYHTDDRADECFRKYDSVEDSYIDHANFLKSRGPYQSLFSLPILDYTAWANGLRKAGYASDKQYPAKLIRLIEKYQLYQFDNEVYFKGKHTKDIENINYKTNNNTVDTYDTYEVKQGDTLYGIARKFDTTVENLVHTNQLLDYNIHIGQQLKIMK